MIYNINSKKPVSKLIFVITIARSGSNMLIGILNSIREIFLRNEISTSGVGKMETNEGLNIIKNFLIEGRGIKLDKFHYTTTGCKLMYSNVWKYSINEDSLKTLNPNLKIIILNRENILDQFISLKLAQKNDKWIYTHEKNGEYKEYHLKIDLENFRSYQRYIRNCFNEYDYLFPNAYKLSYENLIDNKQRIFDTEIFDYLEVKKQKVFFNTQKQNTRTKEEIIINYDEVKRNFGEYF